MVAENGRDELAKVVKAASSLLSWEADHVAATILSSSWLAGQLKQARADAWDVGYQRGLRDEVQDVTHGADNPYA